MSKEHEEYRRFRESVRQQENNCLFSTKATVLREMASKLCAHSVFSPSCQAAREAQSQHTADCRAKFGELVAQWRRLEQ